MDDYDREERNQARRLGAIQSAVTGTQPRLERIEAVIARTGLSRASIYERMKQGTFPQSVRLGEKSTTWLASEVDAWIADRVARRDRDNVHRTR